MPAPPRSRPHNRVSNRPDNSKPVSRDSLAEKPGFQQKLQTVTTKIHATKNIDEIILELSQELCNLFGADRLTIYYGAADTVTCLAHAHLSEILGSLRR